MRLSVLAFVLVSFLWACGAGTAGKDAGLMVDAGVGVDLWDGSHLDVTDAKVDAGKDGVFLDTWDTVDGGVDTGKDLADSVGQDTTDTTDAIDALPDTVPTCQPPCSPYQLCDLETLLCEANPLCETEFCAGEDAGMEKVEGLELFYVDRFEWPNVQWAVPEGGVADLGTATQKCLSVGKRLCTELELAIACSPEGQAYPYGADYDLVACNTELPYTVDPSGANLGCRSPESGVFDLAGNLAEWAATGKLFGGTVRDGVDATCARLAVAEDYEEATLLGLRCCLSPNDDLDGDGVQASLDCDDTNDEVKPGVEEVCNGLDDDCDGQADNTEDADKDGFNSCVDCNDKAGSIYPGADDELGDEVDADCDGQDGEDRDGDGFFSKARGGDDCDDTNPLTYPGATELCDGQDNDCDDNNDEDLGATVCNDDNACTTDSCDGEAKACKHEAVTCEDDNQCTLNDCQPATGCVNTKRSGDCDDQDLCTLSDACIAGECVGMTNTCNDLNPCTSDVCNQGTGACEHQPVDGDCEDADPCSTGDFCQDGQCKAGVGVLDCDDHNDCTTNDCQEGVGCQNTAKQGFCNDGDACTADDYCLDGVCTGGSNSCGCDDDEDCLLLNDADWCNGYLYCNKGKMPAVCELNLKSIKTCEAAGDSTCQAQVCDPGDGVCKFKARNEGQVCAATCTVNPTCQAGQCKGQSCPSAGMSCASGTCISKTCTPAEKVCDGDFAYLTCNGSGNDWTGPTSCGDGKYCDGGECKSQVCTPGSLSCVGPFAGTCNGPGSGLVQGYVNCKSLPATPVCEAGACAACAASCTGKVCGDDGCGGNCGSCPYQQECSPAGTCVFDIATVWNKWVPIPGGTFQMGCSTGDSACNANENPVHQVTLAGFEMLETEVTEGQYQAVLGSNPSTNKFGASHPVETINWSQAKAFCEAIGGRLPTEAEWEYAARAGTATKYYCGNEAGCLDGKAWYAPNADGRKRPVKGKTANAFGLYDMLGNVWEWTNDRYGTYGAGAQMNPPGPDGGSARIIRGGSFDVPGGLLRVSYRDGFDPTYASYGLGFRCARGTSQCVPSCTGKVCGGDGCGGSCGTCGAGGSCVEGTRCTYPGTGGVTWVSIPGGTFQMGCSAGDSQCRANESPVHQVILASFEILETEVTEGQYQAVIGSNPSAHYNGASGADMPVENMNWSQAKAFCQSIGGRLPTEAEWEYAARGGTTTSYSCGDIATCLVNVAWYGSNSGLKKHSSKLKAPNAYGLYDMSGNVWEWTNDLYGDYSSDAQTNPQGPSSGSDRVVRGGSFGDYDFILRMSHRIHDDPSAGYDLGVRCVRSDSQCLPSCVGKVCGDDGCGGSCGQCGAGKACAPLGTCVFNIEALGNKWKSIPGGTFQMGCSAGDNDCLDWESPVHQVTLSGFEMLETEITEGQFQAVMGNNPSHTKSGSNHPVESIDWSEAKAFCERIGGRLPTEAEWEYAARGGTTTRYTCGDDISCLAGIAWTAANSGNKKQPVKGKAANAYGLYDMLGNVWECTNDWYGSFSTGAQTNPQGPVGGYSRVIRGGSFFYYWDFDINLRVSLRFPLYPSERLVFVGIRCAK